MVAYSRCVFLYFVLLNFLENYVRLGRQEKRGRPKSFSPIIFEMKQLPQHLQKIKTKLKQLHPLKENCNIVGKTPEPWSL